jgi:hypothetical protein
MNIKHGSLSYYGSVLHFESSDGRSNRTKEFSYEYLNVHQILYFLIFFLFFEILKKLFDLIIMSHSKE